MAEESDKAVSNNFATKAKQKVASEFLQFVADANQFVSDGL